jgi:hypothetical protein
MLALYVALVGCAAPGLTTRDRANPAKPFVVKELPSENTDRAANQNPTVGTRGAEPVMVWNVLAGDLGFYARFSPPRLARAYTLMHVAIHDALVLRQRGAGSYQTDLIVAGAASTVLEAIFATDRERIAHERDRKAHGVPGAERDLAFGRAVATKVLESARDDGAERAEDAPLTQAEGKWTGINPAGYGAGNWRTWFVPCDETLVPEPPYPVGSPEDLRDLEEIKRIAAGISAQDAAIAQKWAAASPSTIWSEILNDLLKRHPMDTVAAARAHVFLNAAMLDAFISCWRTKYHYWVARPFHRVPGLLTTVRTPNFPSYTSGHATVSGAAEMVLSELFPAEKARLHAQAEEAALSRLLGGIHFRHDNEEGLRVGRRIGERVVAIMRRDGAI